jgi:hypothetical protein
MLQEYSPAPEQEADPRTLTAPTPTKLPQESQFGDEQVAFPPTLKAPTPM